MTTRPNVHRPPACAHRRNLACSLLLSTLASSVGIALTLSLASIPAPVKAAAVSIPVFVEESLDNNGRQLPLGQNSQTILNFIARESGLRLEVVRLPWNRALLKAAQGEGLVYGISKNRERLKVYAYSQPILTAKVWAITYGEPRPNLQSASDLKGKVISIGRGVSHGMAFEEARKTIFRVEEDPASQAARFKKLMAQRCDAMLFSFNQFVRPEEVESHLQKSMLPGFKDPIFNGKVFYASQKPLFLDTIHIASGKGHFHNELETIDRVIQQAEKSGELARLTDSAP